MVRLMYEGQTPEGSGDGEAFAVRLDAVHAVLERVAELEREVRGLQAEQVRQVAAYRVLRQALDADLGVSGDAAQYRAMVAEVAIAKGVSAMTAQSSCPTPTCSSPIIRVSWRRSLPVT
jgi:predicted component of type VI protein secretion system